MNIKQKILYLQDKYERYKPQIQTDLDEYIDGFYTLSTSPAHHLRA